jgi:hypothetical protein
MKVEIPAEKICVLYDPISGSILHTHRVITFAGGREVTDAEMERRCKALAESLGHASTKLKVLHVPSSKYTKTALYYVNVTTGELTEHPAGRQPPPKTMVRML